ncbi:MAG: hypothetical protein M3R31_00650 [Pseudomonadota bacterium]|nr:hypothetical protein [Pseudomonadota bacterium]
MVRVSDPVGSGFIAGFSHPGGNITGVTDYGLDLPAKYVELVRVIVPKPPASPFLCPRARSIFHS